MKAAIKQKGQAVQSTAGSLREQEQLWLMHLDAAQQCWHKLSRAELVQSEGMPHRLSRLLQQYYDLSREQADHQICRFKQSCQLACEAEKSAGGQDIN